MYLSKKLKSELLFYNGTYCYRLKISSCAKEFIVLMQPLFYLLFLQHHLMHDYMRIFCSNLLNSSGDCIVSAKKNSLSMFTTV